MSRVFTPTVRRWIYGVVIAAIPVLIYFDLIPEEAAPVILPLVLAILNVKDDVSPGVDGGFRDNTRGK